MKDPFDEALMDQDRMPVMVVGGVAQGSIVIIPQRANTITLAQGSGFKPMTSPRQGPEIDYENSQEYVLNKIEWLGDDGIKKAIAIAAPEDTPMPAAVEIMFKGYQASLVDPTNDPRVH